MKKFLCLMLALSMFGVLFAGCTKEATPATPESAVTDEAEVVDEAVASDLAYVKEKGKMVIGYTIYEPMNYEENGELTGFDTEFAKAVCSKLGVEPEFVVINWDNKFLELESKGIDCIWNGMTITEEAKLNASVSDAYVKNAQVVVVNAEKAAEITSVANLEGLSFAAEAGSAGEAAIVDNGLNQNYVAVAAQTDALLEVLSGASDACVIDITMANAMTGEGTSYENLVPVLELTTEEYGIAFRKDSDITAAVNEIMNDLVADGTLPTLAEKYNLTLSK